MKPFYYVVMLLFITSCGDSSRKEDAKISEEKVEKNFNSIQQASWLLGDWVSTDTVALTQEYWTQENDSTLLLHGRTLVGIDTVFHERVELQQGPTGTFFTVQDVLKKTPPIAFKMIKSRANADTLVFQNLKHDFPKRIKYWLPASDTLRAYIEGGNQFVHFEFTK